MPDTKISAAADIATVVASDMLPVARSGSSTAYKATMAELSAFANTTLPVASTSVAGVVKVDGTSITIASGVISSGAAPPASTAPPLMDGTAAAGGATAWSRGDHVHPSDTSRVPLSGGTMTGLLTLSGAPTATLHAATKAYVDSVTPAGGPFAPLASPALTGTPTAPTVAPTAAAGTTTLATTAFVRTGTTTNDNALAGQVGEYLSATRTSATQITLTSNTVQDILAVSLTAGDWDVNANLVLIPDSAALMTNALAWLSTSSATQPTLPNNGGETMWAGSAPAPSPGQVMPIGPMRVSIASTTIVYLSCRNQFSAGQVFGYGFIGARRAR